jgi:hypothetical protein
MGSDPVLIEPKAKSFRRQLVLIEEVKQLQIDCEHELTFPTKETITCIQCGALWLK